MTKRLIAVAAAAVLALGMIAFTPTPVAAGPPSGQVKCVFSDGRDIRPEQFRMGVSLDGSSGAVSSKAEGRSSPSNEDRAPLSIACMCSWDWPDPTPA